MADENYDYDLLVIGSGLAGNSATIQGAKLGKSVPIVERATVDHIAAVSSIAAARNQNG